jgi:hypothetical protein
VAGVNVADGHALGVGLAQKAAEVAADALAAHADEADGDAVRRRRAAAGAEGGGGYHVRRGGGNLEEISSLEAIA